MVMGRKVNVFVSLEKVLLAPWRQEGGLGDPPPILGRIWPPGIKRGVWGDPPPIIGRI